MREPDGGCHDNGSSVPIDFSSAHSCCHSPLSRTQQKGKLLSVIIISIVALIFLVSTAVVFIDAFGAKSYKYTMRPQEQVYWCGQTKSSLHRASGDIVVYESLDGYPDISDEVRSISVELSGRVYYGHFEYESFFLPPGSAVTAKKTSKFNSMLSVIKGRHNMELFMDDDFGPQVYEHRLYWTNNTFTFSSAEFDEYFVVVDGTGNSRFSIDFSVTLVTFDTSNLTQKCGSYVSCKLNEDKASEYCVIMDYNVSNSSPSRTVTIKSEGLKVANRDSVIMIIFFLSVSTVAVAIATANIICIFKRNKQPEINDTTAAMTPLTSQPHKDSNPVSEEAEAEKQT